MIQISINDRYLDLYKNTVLPQSFQAANAGDLTTVNTNYSGTIKVPRTQNNDSIFELSGDYRSGSLIPYRQTGVKVISNGIEIVSDAVCYLRDGDYSIYIISGSNNFFDIIGENKLSDLDSFYFNASNSVVSGKRNASSNVVYPVADYGNSIVTGQPYIYDKSILAAIISEAGYTSAGSIFSNTKFNTTVTNAFSDTTGYVSSFRDLRRVSVYVATPQVLALVGFGTNAAVNFTGISEVGTNPYGYWNGTDQYIMNDPNIPAGGILFSFKQTLVLDITTTPGDTVTLTARPIAGSPYGTTFVIATAVGTGKYSFTQPNSFTANSYGYFIRIERVVGVGAVTINSGTYDVEPEGYPIALTYAGAVPDVYLDYAALLPDLTQKNFLKDIMINYGLIITEKNKVLTFISYDDIIGSRSTALDWTSKRTIDKETLSYTPLSYARQNNFKYTNIDTGVSELFAMGHIDVDNENVAVEKDLYISSFSACVNSVSLKINKASVPLFDGSAIPSGELFNIDPGYRKLLVRAYRSGELGVTYPNGISYIDYLVAFFDDPQEPYSLKFQPILNSSYPLFTEALQRSKLINRYYDLSDSDIQSFNFRTLIFDTDAYFIVNKINNYIAGRPTSVDIFKV